MESRQYSYEDLLIIESAEETKPTEHKCMDIQPCRPWAYRHRRAIVLHITLISTYTVLGGMMFWLFGTQGDGHHRPPLIYSLLL